MKHYGYAELKNSRRGSHRTFVKGNKVIEYEQMSLDDVKKMKDQIGVTSPHGGSKDVPEPDVKDAIGVLGVTKKEFYGIVGKQVR